MTDAALADIAWAEATAHRHNARARRYGAPGRVSAGDLLGLLATHPRCALCGKPPPPGERLTLEHKLALSRQGAHDLRNLTLACRRCNQQKANRTLDEWVVWKLCQARATRDGPGAAEAFLLANALRKLLEGEGTP